MSAIVLSKKNWNEEGGNAPKIVITDDSSD
jgi:hypothetical protein